jgi:thioredoxin reductase (NADPH)
MAGLRAMALGQFDDWYWLDTPVGPPEPRFYPVVSELLGQWARETASAGPPPQSVRVVGPRWSARSPELRDLLSRNRIRHQFYDADSDDGRRLLAQARVEPGGQAVVLMPGGQVLADPSPQRFAHALGVPIRPAGGRYDLAVVGAGPAGLAAATYAASEGLRTLLAERLAPGGQAGTSSLIRNYLGFPRGISGRELAQRASEQAIMCPRRAGCGAARHRDPPPQGTRRRHQRVHPGGLGDQANMQLMTPSRDWIGTGSCTQ